MHSFAWNSGCRRTSQGLAAAGTPSWHRGRGRYWTRPATRRRPRSSPRARSRRWPGDAVSLTTNLRFGDREGDRRRQCCPEGIHGRPPRPRPRSHRPRRWVPAQAPGQAPYRHGRRGGAQASPAALGSGYPAVDRAPEFSPAPYRPGRTSVTGTRSPAERLVAAARRSAETRGACAPRHRTRTPLRPARSTSCPLQPDDGQHPAESARSPSRE